MEAHPTLDMETEGFHQDIAIGRDDGYAVEFNILRLEHFTTFVQN